MQFVSTAVLARRECNNGLAELRVVPGFAVELHLAGC